MREITMFSKYRPTQMVDVIYKITPTQLKKLGIKVVLTGLDNTLIAWNNHDGTEELKTWLLEMKNVGITVLVVSNNKDSRIKRVVEKSDLDYIARALKLTARGFKSAEKKLGLEPPEMLMVGDQTMTDIRGANTAGIRNALVQPIIDTDGRNTKISRLFEQKVMKCLSKEHLEMTWRGGLE